MKKFLTALTCAMLAALFAVGFTACDSEISTEAVNLVALSSGTQVGVMNDVDYYVVAEPVATTRVNAIEGLEFVGDLQELYGGENGYPQAVIVAKNELLGYDFVASFLSEIKDKQQWLLDESTSIETIVNAVQSHLTDGLDPTLTTSNLTREVIQNCGINLTYAHEDKEEIKAFMEEFNSVGESYGTPSDDFFNGDNYPTATYEGKVSVYAPDGAPALGLAGLMAEDDFYSGVEMEYNIVDSSTIMTYVTGTDPKADICVLPVNVAVKLLGSGENYKLVGTLTHGNLYIVSTNNTKITTSNLSSLRGKTVGVVNLAAVPGLTFKTILKKYGIEYVEAV